MEQPTKLFFLDAYALIYRAYYGFIKNPRVNSKGLNTSAILGFVNTLEQILNNENPTHIGVAFDPSGPTFRHQAYEKYKAQREETPEAIRASIPIIKKIIEAYQIPILEVSGFEADDVIGTLATKAGEAGIKVFMMTPDKDYAQLVTQNVKMYRPKFGDKEFEVLGVEEVKTKYNLKSPSQVIDMLGLMGDASDNIPGCPGVGEKTAQKLIAEFDTVENLLANTAQLKGALKIKIEQNSEAITFSKFLATIKIDVPIELDLEQLKKAPIDEPKLRALFEELEFKNLADRIFKTNTSKRAENKNSQPNFLDIFAGQSTEEPNDGKEIALETPILNYQLINSQELITQLIGDLSIQKSWAFDTETTNIDPITAQLVGMSFSYQENHAFYVPYPSDQQEAQKLANQFKPLFENEAISKIGQNIKYDLLILQNYGIELKGKLFDTMIAHYLLQPELRHGMDYLAHIYLNHQTIPIEDLIGPKGKNQRSMREVELDLICPYACEDADVTLKLKNIFEKALIQNNFENLFYEIEMPLVPVLAQMERNGVRIDSHTLAALSTQLNQKLIRIEKEIIQLAGTKFNISSPKQVGEILFDKLKIIEKAKTTKTGQYATSEETLQSLKGKHPIVEKILEQRGIKKLITTYIDSLPNLVNYKSRKIHTSFNQTVTATGRLSSSNPNLQNIPIRDEDGKEIRKAFIPEDKEIFFSADYSQIELRIMAHLSQDVNMIAAFQSGEDIHTATAAKIFKIPIQEVTSDMRRKAKTANFGIIYGISVFGLADRLTIERKEAKELIDGYFETYPDIKKHMETCIQEAQEKGYVETLFNRKRFLPDINSKNSIVRGYAERNAINAPIQGSAADIIKVAMIKIAARFKKEKLKATLILQVHDELNFSVPLLEKEIVAEIVIQEMENAIKLLVPLKVDCGSGENWLQAH